MGKLADILRQPALWMIWLGAALVYSWIYPLPYSSEQVQDIAFTVIDLDQSAASRSLVRALDATAAVQISAVEHQLSTPIIANRLIVPSDFNNQLSTGQQTTLSVHLDGHNLLNYSTSVQAINNVVDDWSQAYRDLHGYQQLGVANSKLISLHESRHQDSYLLYLVPAIFAFLLQQTLVIASAYWQSAHRAHSWQAKLVALFGSLLALVYLFAGVLRHYGVEVSNWSLLLQAWLPMALASLYLGKLSGYWIERPEAVFLWWVPLSLPFLLLSGFSWPAAQQAPWLQTFAELLPSTHAVSIFTQLCQSSLQRQDIVGDLLRLWQLVAIYATLDWLIRGYRAWRH